MDVTPESLPGLTAFKFADPCAFRWMWNHPVMNMTLRYEIFPRDLDAIVDFYARVLGFSVTKDQRGDPEAYVALSRGEVHIGAARRAGPAAPAERRPPIGVEVVLEVDDIKAERCASP